MIFIEFLILSLSFLFQENQQSYSNKSTHIVNLVAAVESSMKRSTSPCSKAVNYVPQLYIYYLTSSFEPFFLFYATPHHRSAFIYGSLKYQHTYSDVLINVKIYLDSKMLDFILA